MTRIQAVSKKIGAVAGIALSVTALSVAAPSLSAFAAPKPAACTVEAPKATKTQPVKSEPKGAKKVLASALDAFGIASAGAEVGCNFQLQMADWGGYSIGNVVSVAGHAELSVGQATPFYSAAGVETVAYARVGCQDQQSFRISRVDLTVESADGTQKLVVSGANINVQTDEPYYTMKAADVTVETQIGTDLSFRANENGWLVITSANPGHFTTTFHMVVDPIN